MPEASSAGGSRVLPSGNEKPRSASGAYRSRKETRMKSIVRVEFDMRFKLGFQVSARHLIAAVLLWLSSRM